MKKNFYLIVVLLLFITGCGKIEKENENNWIPKYVSKCYVGDFDDDGWFKYLCIEPSKKDSDKRDTINNYSIDGQTNYVFDGINLKYRKLDGYYIPIYDENKNELSKVDATYPSYSISIEYRDEIEKINQFLNSKKFNREVTLDDFNDLVTQFFQKEELVSMFNYAYNKKPVELGKYLDLPFVAIEESISNNGFHFQVGYYSEYGNISKVNIELIYDDGVYLSDLIRTNKASKDQEEIYYKISKIEQYIVTEQTLDISASTDYDSSLKLLSNLLKGIISKYE